MESVCAHRGLSTHTHRMLFFLPSTRIFWVNNFDIRNTILSIVWRGRGEESHHSNVLFMCLSFIRCLRCISRETLSHFKNSPAISEIIGRFLVLSRLHVQSSFFFFFFFLFSLFSFPHATELPKRSLFLSLSLSLFLLTMCQHVDVSNNNNNTRLCEWLRSHFGQVPYKMHYSEMQLDTEFSVVALQSVMQSSWVVTLKLF